MKWIATQNSHRNRSPNIIVFATILLFLAACSGPATPPEEELRQWVSSAKAAAEAKERRAMLDLISPDYVDGRNFKRDDIGDMLRVYFLRQNNITLLTSIDEIRLYGDSAAEIDMTVGMAGTNDSVFGFSADAYSFQLELENDGDDWLLIAARWGEVGQELR
jgi:hypothetical protein